MAAGAAYDLAFAAAMIFFPRGASRLLGVAAPDDPTYLGLAGVLLVLLAAMYLLAAWNPRRNQGIVTVAAAGRLLGFVYLGWAAWGRGGPTAFAAAAVADLAFALLHAGLLVHARRADVPQVPEDPRS